MASPELVLQWDRKLLKPFQDKAIDRAIFRAVSRAGGDGVRALRTAASRAVRARKRMKASKVNAAMKLRFPRGAKHVDDLVWHMDVSRDPVPMADYPFRQVKRGVSVAINKGARSLVKGAFVATMQSGHTGVFVRKGKARLPIEELFTTRVSDLFNDSGMVPAVYARGGEVFAKSFARLLPLELGKL
jgi:Prophage minor tail protein Z (GPZ)